MVYCRPLLIGLPAVLLGFLASSGPALSADLGPGPGATYVQPAEPASQWTFDFTPYGWFTGINGNATTRGHTVDVNESFIEIAENSDSFAALMGYFEARKGRLGLFTDVVWADLGFPGQLNVKRSPFARLPSATISVKGRAQLDYESTIIQSGVAYEVAKWANGTGPGFTALDVTGSARYWNQQTDLTLNVSGTLEADLKRLGLKVKRSRSFALADGGTLEWIDPVVGMRLRHRTASGSDLDFIGDVGGFGAGSEFSWQAVATYGFDVSMFGSTMRSVVGYRALSVDYSENGRHGRNGIDWIQHGPLLGVNFSW